MVNDSTSSRQADCGRRGVDRLLGALTNGICMRMVSLALWNANHKIDSVQESELISGCTLSAWCVDN